VSNRKKPIDTVSDEESVSSKTARKREADRLQNIGRRISGLNQNQIDALELTPALHKAIGDYRRFPSHGAKRRQLQFVGKLMRNTDTQQIEDHLADLDGESAQARYKFNQLEQWRDDLLRNPEAMTRFIAAFPGVDRQQLRQIVKKHNATQNLDQQKAAAKNLFRFIRHASEIEDS